MINRGIALVLIIFSMGLAGCASSPSKMQKEMGLVVMDSVEIEDYSVVLHMKDDYSAAFTVHKTSDPYLAVVEIPDLGLGGLPEKIQSNKLGISEVRFTMIQTPVHLTRVEILMDAPMDLEPVKVGKSLVINLLGKDDMTARKQEATQDIAATGGIDLLPATEVTELAVSRSGSDVKLTIFSDGTMEPDIFTLAGRIIIDIPGVTMKATLPNKVFSPIKGVRYGAYADKVRVVLDMEEDGDFAASTEDNTVVIIIPTDTSVRVLGTTPVPEVVAGEGDAAITDAGPDGGDAGMQAQAGVAAGTAAGAAAGAQEAQEAPEELKYKGKHISLDFQNADIVPIFRFIGDIAKYNVVIHPNVSGRITLKLIDVPWDQALDIVLEIAGMASEIDGNIMRIAPPDVFLKQKESKQKVQEVETRTEELLQVAIHLAHISAAEMKERVNEAKLLSPRGTIRIDERTNTLILNDTQTNIKKIRDEEVKYWDTPLHGTMQVLIEAKIVSVRTDYTHNFGIRWGGHATDQNFTWMNQNSTFDFSVNTPVGSASPAAGVSGGLLSVGYAETIQVDLSLEALETVKKAKSLANPRVMTIDKKPATISQGTAIPYATQADGGGTTIQTTDATLSLNVTPEIRPNGIVMLKVTVTNDSPTVIPGAVAPGIDKQQINTNALVKDGETLVLGGIFTSTEDESEVRVPILSKIPIIGWLFKTRSVSKIPNELLIFITPKIIKS